MFCDLVGSTPLSARYDPEDLREIIGAYHRCVADTVARFAGFVAKYMGDGVLIYFGYPEAHEDDAERAVRAGLAVIDAVGRLATPEPLNVRLGIASGLVVVGDLIGAGAAQERGVVGETPNLAARLQALAATGHARHCREHAAADRRLVRARGSRTAAACRLCRTAARLARRRRKRRGQPLRGVALGGDAARRARRRARPVAAALAAGESRRGAGGAGLGRAGDRQIAPDRGAVAAHRRASRTRGCAISARPTIRTARSTRSSPSSNAPPGSRATTRSKRSSASCANCSRPVRAAMMKSSCWPSCCHCRIPPPISTSARSASARCCSKRCCISSKPWRGAGPS